LYRLLLFKTDRMDWHNYIVSDKNILLGKPCIKGTRLSVEFIISLMAQGWTEETILRNYPNLTKEHIQSVFGFIQDCMEDGLFYTTIETSG